MNNPAPSPTRRAPLANPGPANTHPCPGEALADAFPHGRQLAIAPGSRGWVGRGGADQASPPHPVAPTSPGRGWQASLDLGLGPWQGRTALMHRRQRGPLAVQRPFYPEGEVCHLYLLHPPGGVVGGDGLEIAVWLEPGAKALITTPGATKFYRSQGDEASQDCHLHLGDQAALEWLPQENIHFSGVQARLKTRVDLNPTSRFLGWECQCLGRPALAEGFDRGELDCQFQVWRDGLPLLLERLRLTPQSRLGAAGLRGRPVTATLIATPAGQTELDRARALLGEGDQAGVTLLEELLVVRYLGDSTEACRHLFTRIWTALRPSVLGLAPCPPRIWAT